MKSESKFWVLYIYLLTIDIGSQESVIVRMTHDLSLHSRSVAVVVVIVVALHVIKAGVAIIVVVMKNERGGISVTILIVGGR
jgi:zinc transporter ZupT